MKNVENRKILQSAYCFWYSRNDRRDLPVPTIVFAGMNYQFRQILIWVSCTVEADRDHGMTGGYAFNLYCRMTEPDFSGMSDRNTNKRRNSDIIVWRYSMATLFPGAIFIVSSEEKRRQGAPLLPKSYGNMSSDSMPICSYYEDTMKQGDTPFRICHAGINR